MSHVTHTTFPPRERFARLVIVRKKLWQLAGQRSLATSDMERNGLLKDN
jgi:hypothetical protein